MRLRLRGEHLEVVAGIGLVQRGGGHLVETVLAVRGSRPGSR